MPDLNRIKKMFQDVDHTHGDAASYVKAYTQYGDRCQEMWCDASSALQSFTAASDELRAYVESEGFDLSPDEEDEEAKEIALRVGEFMADDWAGRLADQLGGFPEDEDEEVSDG